MVKTNRSYYLFVLIGFVAVYLKCSNEAMTITITITNTRIMKNITHTETAQEMIQDLARAQQEFNATNVNESGDLVEMIQELEPSFRLSEIYKWL